jgi:hypothetical protein
MRYWRCWEIPVLSLFWPLFGHLIYFQDGFARCERCPWRQKLPDFLRA